VTYRVRRASDSTLAAGAKVGNYLVSVLAVREAKARGGAEALIVDGGGRIVEGATSNVFFVTADGRLVTPPEDAGILPGITRETLFAVARTLGIEVVMLAPLLGDLGSFEEVFITSSIRELLPVVRIDEGVVGRGRPGPVFERLLAAFRDAVRTSRD
jgi:branched-chain amino acid aminotransferase